MRLPTYYVSRQSKCSKDVNLKLFCLLLLHFLNLHSLIILKFLPFLSPSIFFKFKFFNLFFFGYKAMVTFN